MRSVRLKLNLAGEQQGSAAEKTMKLTGLVLALAISTLLAVNPAAAATTKSGMPLAKDVRAACGKDVKAQGLKGKEASAARATCFAKQRPDLAARSACRKDARAKGLGKDETSALVKACTKSL